MSTVNGIDTCEECGEDALTYYDSHTLVREVICTNSDCLTNKTPLQLFEYRLQKSDFAIGDSFWLDEFEFTVTRKK